jgi:predicted amidohydrolase YtcJ
LFVTADLLFHNGPIHTISSQIPAEALLTRAGKIFAVGKLSDLENLTDSSTKKINLEGRALLPGFNDAHIHVWKVGHLRTTMLDLRGLTKLEDVYKAVSTRAKTLEPGEWLLGRGWNEAILEGGGPTKAGLDQASPQNPVVLTRTCAHIHAANSSAFDHAKISSESEPPAGGQIEFERGWLFETAHGLMLRVIPAFTVTDYEKFIRAGLEYLSSFGITSCTDPAVDPGLLEAYRNLEARNELPIRVNLLFIRRPDGGSQTYPLPEKFVSDFLRCDSVKFFGDGGLSGATAAVSIPYQNLSPGSPAHGVLRFETEELYGLALDAHENGFRIGTHAIGDVALDQILEVYRRLNDIPVAAQRAAPLRHRIEHFGLPGKNHLGLAKKLNVIVVPQPIFLHELRANFLRYLPAEFVSRCYNLRSMFDAGLTVAFSSDGPVVAQVNPLENIKAAMLEPLSKNAEVTLPESLRAWTLNGAIAQGDESNRGTLEPGKHADLIVMTDPYSTKLEDWKLERTYVAGKEIS